MPSLTKLASAFCWSVLAIRAGTNDNFSQCQRVAASSRLAVSPGLFNSSWVIGTPPENSNIAHGSTTRWKLRQIQAAPVARAGELALQLDVVLACRL